MLNRTDEKPKVDCETVKAVKAQKLKQVANNDIIRK